MRLQDYLRLLADSDLFGTLAFVSLVVAVLFASGKLSDKKVFRLVVFVCLMFMPILHLIGSYYLSKPAP
ncbi:hypothetical protein BUE93_11235 [Chromobacterium amazonense]|uniref:Uncharacterized protein n=1 Tax=Chromobacterium amazonense TaxID=1382803 RepID=A0A2S9X534_9NEIS|nr:hypothetical protein BUE93_11235 [Chromobacterium amazonense]